MSTPLAAFGPGILIASRTDIAIPSPVNVGFSQEFTIDATGVIKELFGQNQWPLAVARGTIKGTGKFKSAVISGLAWSALFYGNAETTSNQIAWNVGSTFTLSTGSTTATQVGSSLTFDADLGITYVTSGLPFQRVSTGTEAAGKYSITTGSPGLYNFATADTTAGPAGGTFVKITYTNTTSVGANLTVTNQLIGSTPTFQLDYYTNFNQPASKPFVVRIFSCVASKHMMNFKLEDFMIPEFDFSLFANAAGNVYSMTFPEIS
jgi:hypothetical protein